jgi:hypothetical protein
MTPQSWDPDEATASELDTEDESLGSVWRYGVTDWEASHAEPLDVALSQEVPEPVSEQAEDEQWSQCAVDTEPFAGRLVADEALGDDDYAFAVDDLDEFAAEELAMHLVQP